MNQDPAFTPERLNALNAVDLRLVGVTHGITRYTEDHTPYVEGGNSDHFDMLMSAASELDAERGDRLAVEPTGFKSTFTEELTLSSILPANVPDIPVEDMPPELREEIVAFLEKGRHELYLNNLLYTAAHTLLRGVPVQRAEISLEDWQALENILPELAPPDAQNQIKDFYRNTKMLARLGDIAIDMTAPTLEQASDATDAPKPILLSATGRAHTPRLTGRLLGGNVSFSAIM